MKRLLHRKLGIIVGLAILATVAWAGVHHVFARLRLNKSCRGESGHAACPRSRAWIYRGRESSHTSRGQHHDISG